MREVQVRSRKSAQVVNLFLMGKQRPGASWHKLFLKFASFRDGTYLK